MNLLPGKQMFFNVDVQSTKHSQTEVLFSLFVDKKIPGIIGDV